MIRLMIFRYAVLGIRYLEKLPVAANNIAHEDLLF